MAGRLPRLNQVIRVYAVIACLTYAWMIVGFLWKLPSWLHFLTVWEILSILSYAFFETFIESLLMLGLLVAICLPLPPRFLRNDFATRGTWSAFVVIGAIVLLLKYSISIHLRLIVLFVAWSSLTLLAVLFFSFLSTRLRWLDSVASWVSDRLVVFLYILVPASLVSMLVVLVRNVVGV